MGEAKRKKSATARFIAQYPQCCFCAGERPATTREHMPPKAAFDYSHRPDKLIMPACDQCNGETSTADLVTAVVCRWGYINTEQENADHHRLISQVRKQAAELLQEWTKPIDRESVRAHLEAHGVQVPPDAGMASIGPLTIRQLNLFAYKFALAIYFEKFRECLPETGRVSGFWRTKEDFGRQGIPPKLLAMMTQYGTLEQGKWNTREIFEYRFETNRDDGLLACLGRFRGNLFVTGLATRDASLLPKDEASDWTWIRPSELLKISNEPKFEKRP
jgi:hypothetical protein